MQNVSNNAVPLQIRCSNCGETKPIAAFWRQGTKYAGLVREGHSNWCRTCASGKRTQHEMLPDDHPLIVAGTRECNWCGETKPLVEFHRTRYAKFGRQYTCKKCNNLRKPKKARKAAIAPTQREYRRISCYGMTAQQFLALLKSQDGKCAICAADLDALARDTCVDHDHKTGIVRGILCGRCNLGIGHMRDDIALMEAAVVYLKKHAGDR